MIIFLDVIKTNTDKNDIHIQYKIYFPSCSTIYTSDIDLNTKNKHYKKLQFKMSYIQISFKDHVYLYYFSH